MGGFCPSPIFRFLTAILVTVLFICFNNSGLSVVGRTCTLKADRLRTFEKSKKPFGPGNVQNIFFSVLSCTLKKTKEEL